MLQYNKVEPLLNASSPAYKLISLAVAFVCMRVVILFCWKNDKYIKKQGFLMKTTEIINMCL